MSGEFDFRHLLWQSRNVNWGSIKPKPNFCGLAKHLNGNLESKLASPLHRNSHPCYSAGLLAEAPVIGVPAKVRLLIKIQVFAPRLCHHRHLHVTSRNKPIVGVWWRKLMHNNCFLSHIHLKKTNPTLAVCSKCRCGYNRVRGMSTVPVRWLNIGKVFGLLSCELNFSEISLTFTAYLFL